MKAVVWLGPRHMEIQELPLSTPVPGEVIVHVEAVGICGSEIAGYLGHNSLRVPPLVMGHEVAGQVVALGAHVTQLRAGDRVAINPLLACHACAMCARGMENLCERRQLIGVHRPGAFAEYVAVPASSCCVLPSTMEPVAGALAEPLACGIRTVRLGAVQPGTRVAIFGAGTIGLMCLQAVRKAGGHVVQVIDVNPDRLAAARAWGALRTCNAATTDPEQPARQISDGTNVDVAIDAVGSTATRKAVVRAVRPGGTVIFVGLHEEESVLEANYVVRSEVRIAGSFAYTRVEFEQALSMLAAGDVRPDPSWLEERPLDACADAFAQLADTHAAVAKIVLRPQ